MGHLGLSLVVFGDIPTGNPNGPPSTSFLRAERRHPCVVRLRSDRDARLRFASPRRGGGGRKKDNLQKEFYTGPLQDRASRLTVKLLIDNGLSEGLEWG